jgi:ribonuclease HI
MLQVHNAATRQETWSLVREAGWVVVNTDGARRNKNVCGCGGLIWGNGGAWLGGFAKGLGECSVIMAELSGAFERLKLESAREYKKVELQMDV